MEYKTNSPLLPNRLARSNAVPDQRFQAIHGPVEIAITKLQEWFVEQSMQRSSLRLADLFFPEASHLLEPGPCDLF